MTVPKIGSVGHVHFPAFTSSNAGTQAGAGVIKSAPLTQNGYSVSPLAFSGRRGR